MEHIKPPVRYDPSRGDTIKDAKHRLIAVLPEGAVECASEIVQAVNAYAPLVVQRDALVAACRLFTRAYYGNGGTDVNWELYDRAALDALAALALVKGDQKSDDATT